MKQQNISIANSKQGLTKQNYKEVLGIGTNYGDKAIMTRINTKINKIINFVKAVISELQRRRIFIIIILILFGFLIHYILNHLVGIRNGLKKQEDEE